MQLNAYLNFDSDCEAAFNDYDDDIGGNVATLPPFGEGLMAKQTPAEYRDGIMRAHVHLDDGTLKGSDCTPEHPHEPVKSAYVVLHVSDEKKAERIFNALADGGTVTISLQQTLWAHRYGMAVDRFGVPYIVNCAKPT